MVQDQLGGLTGLFGALFGFTILIAVTTFAYFADSGNSLPWDVEPDPREAQPEGHKPYKGAPWKWIIVLIAAQAGYGFYLNLQPDATKAGQIGDSMNVFTIFILLVGFAFTIRQINHSELTSVRDAANQRANLVIQQNLARLQFVQACLKKEDDFIALAVESESFLSELRAELSSYSKSRLRSDPQLAAFTDRDAIVNISKMPIARRIRDLRAVISGIPARNISKEELYEKLHELHTGLLSFRDLVSNNLLEGERPSQVAVILMTALDDEAVKAEDIVDSLIMPVQWAANTSRSRHTALSDELQALQFSSYAEP
jgi:hypothetical protein